MHKSQYHTGRRMATAIVAIMLSLGAMAQSNGSNSSYSRFGLGLLNEQGQGFNRGMAGVAQGYRSGTQVNAQNPASYSQIDSLTFIFDAGMGMQQGHFKGNGNSVNAFNASLEYVTAGLRLTKGLGLSFGFLPYSTIGYNFDVTNNVGSSQLSSQAITTKTTYYGNGGLHELYLGLGWRPFADLSIGVNAGYLWGDFNHSLAQTFYEGAVQGTGYNAQREEWSSDLKTYKLDFGVQYPIHIGKSDLLTLGASVSLGHTIGSDVNLIRYTSQGDTIKSTTSKAFDMPYAISAGATWRHGGRLTIGADYTLERWQGCKVPVSYANATTTGIRVSTDQYTDKHRLAAGAEYIRSPQPGGKYADHIRYRVGASYTSPYVKVNGHDGPREYGITAGLGLPLTTSSRSLINVGLEWKRRSPSVSNQITENYLMVHLGVTFNEAWFNKFKFQ